MPPTEDAPEMVPAAPVTSATNAAAHAEGVEQAHAEVADTEARIEAQALSDEEPEAKPVERKFPEEHEHYVIQLWKGIPSFKCKDCAYAWTTRDELYGVRSVMSHWVDMHSEAANTEMVPSGVTDQNGNPIMRRQQRRKG